MKESWSRWFGPAGRWLEGLTLLEKVALTTVLTVLGAGWVLVFLGSQNGADQEPGFDGQTVAVLGDDFGGAEPSGDSADDTSSWLDPPGTQEAKRLEAKKRDVERSILWNSKIRRARILIQRGRAPRFRSASGVPDTAAVHLHLKRGAATLPAAEAGAIRSLIQHGFNVDPARVNVTYVSNDEFRQAEAGREEPELQRSLRTEIMKLCDAVFDPDEYTLAVTVVQSQRSESRETRHFDPAKTLSVPTRRGIEHQPSRLGGLGPATIKKTEEDEVLSSVERSVVKIPAGEVEAVQVSLFLDLRAVHALVDEGRALHDIPLVPQSAELSLSGVEGLIARFEGSIGILIPHDGRLQRQVSVWAVPFKGVPLSAEHGELAKVSTAGTGVGLERTAETTPAAVQPPVADTDRSDTAEGGFLGRVDPRSVVPLGIAVALSIAVLGWWLIRRSSTVRINEGEPQRDVAPSAREGGYRATGLAAGLEAERSGGTLGPLQPRMAEDLLETVDATSASVRERPELAASVLRLWLAQDNDAGEANLE